MDSIIIIIIVVILVRFPLPLGLPRQIAYDVLILALVHLLTIAPVTQRQLLLLAAGHSLGRFGYLGCWTKKYIVSN